MFSCDMKNDYLHLYYTKIEGMGARDGKRQLPTWRAASD
jgi:hypothetical protein